MVKTTKKTIIEYPVIDFIDLVKDKLFGENNNVSVKFIIREVGGDYLDRYPGQNQVVAVHISYEEKC